ncbi:unnamed protein product, partial [Staurois parvus]
GQRIGDSGNRRATYPWAGVSGTQRDSSCGVWPSTAPTSFLGTSGSRGLNGGITGSYTPGTPWGGSSKGSLGV